MVNPMPAKTNPKPVINRVATGFPTLDAMLEGGIPRNSVTLLSGSCGTGKSTLAMQFLYYGAKVCDEPGVYLTLEENADTLIRNMSIYGWDLEDLVRRKKLMVIKPEVYKFDSLKQIIADAIDKIGAKRLVVDSYSVLLTHFSDATQIRNGLVQLDREIKKMGCTAIVISDIRDNTETFSTSGVEEFIVDGVIVVSLVKDPKDPYNLKRAITVRKMRATRHPLNMHSFDIDEDGASVGGELSWSGKPGKFAVKIARKGKAGKPQAPKKPESTIKAPDSYRERSKIEISALKKKGGHSWKWQHL